MTSFFGDCLFTISLPFYFWSYLSRSIDLPFWFISVINWTVAWALGLIFVVGLRDRSQCSSPGHLPFSSNDAFYFENLFILFFLLASILFTFFFYLLAYRRVELRKGRQMLGKRIKWLLLSIVLLIVSSIIFEAQDKKVKVPRQKKRFCAMRKMYGLRQLNKARVNLGK